MFEEKRSEQRINRKLVVVGIVTNCEDDKTLNGCPIRCETIDISGKGMQFKSDIELPVTTLLSISIAYTLEDIFHVAAEVRWHNCVEGEHYIGVQLIQDEDSDFDKWVALLKSEIES